MIKTAFEFGPLVVWALMLLTVVRPLRLKLGGSVAVAALLLVASQKFLVYKIFCGDSFVPDLPERLITFMGWMYSSSMLLFALSVVWSLMRLVRRIWKRQASMVLSRRVISELAVLAMALAGWGIWEGVRVPDVRRIEIVVQDLPAAFDGLRLVHLTDLHCSPASRKARMAGIVAKVNALKPDLVCITGDFVDGSPGQRADDLSPLKDLKATDGVFGCPGNHEYYSDYVAWRPIFESFGITMLDNAHRVVTRGDAKLAVGGVTDLAAAHNRSWSGKIRKTTRLEPTDVKKAFAGAPADACRILLQHRPLWPQVNEEHGVRLQLSGHTHGGAIRGLDLLVARMGNHGFVRGFYQVGRMALYVNPGTGQWAGFPLRLGVPAEITEMILRKGN